MKILRRILIPVVILGVLFLGANLVIQQIAEDRIASAVQSSFDLQSKPAVTLGGFPLAISILSGSLPSLSFHAENVVVEQLTLASVAAEMSSLTSEQGLLQTKDLRVTIGRGEIRGTATQQAINAYLKIRGEDARITIRAGGVATARKQVTVAGSKHVVTATGKISVRGSTFRFDPGRVRWDGKPPPALFADLARREATVEEEIPLLPGGVAITRIETDDGSITFVAELEGFVFPPE